VGTDLFARPVIVSPTWKLLRACPASAAVPVKMENTNAQRNMPRSRCAAAFPIAARMCRNGTQAPWDGALCRDQNREQQGPLQLHHGEG
jgi:hypothetical protein